MYHRVRIQKWPALCLVCLVSAVDQKYSFYGSKVLELLFLKVWNWVKRVKVILYRPIESEILTAHLLQIFQIHYFRLISLSSSSSYSGEIELIGRNCKTQFKRYRTDQQQTNHAYIFFNDSL